MIGASGQSHVGPSMVQLRGPAVLLLAILLPLILTCCGPFGGPPGKPANQRYGYVGEDKVLKWDSSAGADFYTVYSSFFLSECRLLDGRPFLCEELASGIQQPTYVLTDQGSNRFYWVVACNDSGCSEIDSENPAEPPPPSPDEVSAVQEGSSLRLSWNSVPEAAYYQIYAECPGVSDCIAEIDGNVVGTAYTHTPPPIPPEPYDVEVVDRSANSLTVQWRAFEGNSYSRYLKYFVTACNNALCSENDGYRNAVTVEFSFRLQVLHYQVSRKTQGGEYESVDSGSTRLHYVDEGLDPRTIYYYRVQACTDGGCSRASDETGGLTEFDGPVEVPRSATGFRGEKVRVPLHHDMARLTWDTVAGATYYEVYQGSANESDPPRLDAEISAPQTSYRDSGPNTWAGGFRATSYTIKACNKAGCSPLSETITVR